MKKETLILIILTIIIVFLAVLVLWPAPNQNNKNQNISQPNGQQKIEGIKVDVPKENEQISSPLKISGTVNGGGWIGFEGQVGTVQLLDVKGKEIALGILTAKTDWMKLPVQFEATLIFNNSYKGQATLLFSNENPSGDPSKAKKFGLPVVIK